MQVNGGNYSGTGIVGATALILVTTLDDCVWLVPFLGSEHRRIVLQHAACFAATLLSLTTIVGYGTLLLQKHAMSLLSSTNERGLSIVWSCIGALLCWGLAFYFYCKARRKRQRRKQEAAARATSPEEASVPDETSLLFGATPESPDTPSEEANAVRMEMPTAQPWTVVFLTITGFLDEVSYFPALILGQIFTVPELIVATALTVVMMLVIVTQCLASCRPVLQCFDRVPLYGIITLFAILLTIDAALDITSTSDE